MKEKKFLKIKKIPTYLPYFLGGLKQEPQVLFYLALPWFKSNMKMYNIGQIGWSASLKMLSTLVAHINKNPDR